MEALARGIAAYGTPQEILTDQGRQYTAWRGETDFEKELRRQGIRHVKSRPQHPQTLGKVERFWKTLWEEFLSRTVFADFADCERRLGLFVDAYNFQRPHQGIEGLVPADRFFRSAPQVREAIEKSITENARRLSLEQPARKPFYLVGRLGDRDLTIAAAGSGLRVQTRLNGRVMQDGSTSDLIFDVATLISLLSEACTLQPGDLLVTGTPAGVGFTRKPPVFMKSGDVCEVEVEGVGTLVNPVADDLA